MNQRVIILDRDGVINQDSDAYIKSAAEWEPIPGSLEAIAKLNQAGYRVAVATNQSGLSRGYFSDADLQAMHEKFSRLLGELNGEVATIAYCPHGPDDKCDCRKPLPGLFQQISVRLGIDLQDVPAVGDSGRDLEAAQAVGAQPILVRTGKGERTIATGVDANIPIYANLAAVANAILVGEINS